MSNVRPLHILERSTLVQNLSSHSRCRRFLGWNAKPTSVVWKPVISKGWFPSWTPANVAFLSSANYGVMFHKITLPLSHNVLVRRPRHLQLKRATGAVPAVWMGPNSCQTAGPKHTKWHPCPFYFNSGEDLFMDPLPNGSTPNLSFIERDLINQHMISNKLASEDHTLWPTGLRRGDISNNSNKGIVHLVLKISSYHYKC